MSEDAGEAIDNEPVGGDVPADTSGPDTGTVDAAPNEPEPLGPPEWLPEKFWKDGQPNVEALAKSYQHLESKLGKPQEVPEEYARPEGVELNFEAPIFNEFNTDAKELGLSQDQYEKLVAKYGPNLTDPSEQEKAWEAQLEAEFKALGPDANKRIDSILNWGKNNLGPEDSKIIEDLMVSADSVRVIERLIQGSRDKRLPRRVEGLSQGMTGEELKAMAAKTNDKGQRLMSIDPNYRKEVEAAYASYYGNQPAEQIVSGMR